MKKIFLTIFSIFIVSIASTIFFPSVHADSCIDSCPNNFEPDFSCVNRKILDPTFQCCENKCKGSGGVSDPVLQKYNDYGILGVKVRITEEGIPSLVNVIITTFLGIIALYALFRGIYVAGVKRTRATESNLEEVNRELTNIVIAFVIAFSFIFIIQVVFNLLGLGGLTDFNVDFTGNPDPNTPQIVISGSDN